LVAMDANDPAIRITMTRMGAEKGSFTFQVSREADFRDIKLEVEKEWGLDVLEQRLIFRGMPVKEPDAYQPFLLPDMQDVIAEAGDVGLQMIVLKKPLMTPEFCRKEGLIVGGKPDVNQRTKTGATALQRAVRQCSFSVVEELLANRLFKLCDARDKQGQTALHIAVQCRIRELCEVLLVNQPRFKKVGSRDSSGQTALHYAACWGDAKVVRMILDHKAFTQSHVRLKDKRGYRALQYAADCGHEEVLQMIADAAPPREDSDGSDATDLPETAYCSGDEVEQTPRLQTPEVKKPASQAKAQESDDGPIPEEMMRLLSLPTAGLVASEGRRGKQRQKAGKKIAQRHDVD